MDGRYVIRWSVSVRICVLAVATMAIGAGSAHGQGQHTKEAIVKAWKERQERIKSARFEWTERQTEMKGSLSYHWKKFDPNVRETVPPTDVTFADPRELSLDGRKLRYAYTRRHWSPLKGNYERQSYVSVFNGETCALLHGPTTEHGWHQGQIRRESYHVESNNLHLQPILMAFRALTPRMRAFDIANFDVTGANAIIGSRPCLELSQKATSSVENRLWVDPARGFVVVRSMTLNNGGVWHKLDIHYTLSAGRELVPDRWSIVFNRPDGSGHLESSHEASVTRYALNGAIPNADFEIDFPPGTRFIDERGGRGWMVVPDGSARSINWLIVGGIALALVGLVVVFLKWRRLTKGRIVCSGQQEKRG